MYDVIEQIGKSTVQHGPLNKRVYLMKLDKSDFPQILEKLDLIALKNNYTKIFAKVPQWAAMDFRNKGYITEAYIPDFYRGEEGVHFISLFIDHGRSHLNEQTRLTINKNVNLALSKKNINPLNYPDNLKIKIITENDVTELAELYKIVFKTYPFPIFEKDYILETMKSHINYFGAFIDNKLVAASSAEMDLKGKNVEMTDFATHPDFRGQNLSVLLLKEMEALMRKKKMKMAYTIARSLSAGMNITFSKMGYKYAGTLINNTDISGKIESMNVWYKPITVKLLGK